MVKLFRRKGKKDEAADESAAKAEPAADKKATKKPAEAATKAKAAAKKSTTTKKTATKKPTASKKTATRAKDTTATSKPEPKEAAPVVVESDASDGALQDLVDQGSDEAVLGQAATSDSATAGNAAPLPLFYKQPRPLTQERHGGKSFVEQRNYGYASGHNSVPINAEEFRLAGKSYPIVFTTGKPALPVVVMGLKEGQNLFVDNTGSWTSGMYIPAYVRRYPFIFSEGRKDGELVLCVDEGSEFLLDGIEGEGRKPLFVDGEPSELTKRALEYCSAFQKQYALTRAFVQSLEQHDLLISREVRFTVATGAGFALRGFQVIDEEKLRDLPDEIFLKLRRRGWLPLVYCHLMSVSNLVNLGELTTPAQGAAAD